MSPEFVYELVSCVQNVQINPFGTLFWHIQARISHFSSCAKPAEKTKYSFSSN